MANVGMRARVVLLSGILLTSSGCGLFRVHQDIWRLERSVDIRGEVVGAEGGKPVAIILVRDHWGKKTIYNYSVRYGSGSFRFTMTPGSANLFAFEDRNEDLKYQKGEPAAWYGGTAPTQIKLDNGEIAEGLTVRLTKDIPSETDNVVSLERTSNGAVKIDRYTYSAGEVTDLDDARFTADKGKQGLFEPVHAAILTGYGVYLLERYDPKKVAVLFVHGAGGYPQEFRTLIDHLDRTRFQPWVLQYPSGLRLEMSSDMMVRALIELYAKYKYERLVVVAHSMGGLVSRAAINKIIEEYPQNPIKLFLTISTPWDGVDTAKMGVEHSPLVIPSWIDVAPDSPFLQKLFAKPLPKTVAYYLLFSVVGGNGTDGAVPITSELSLRAQADATRIYGFPENHTSILRSDAAILRVNTLLQEGR